MKRTTDAASQTDVGTPTTNLVTAELVFAGSGEMRALGRALDWAATPLGPVEDWTHSLRTTVRTLLGSRSPMFLWWGPELVQIYNDAYRPSFGASGRHPHCARHARPGMLD